MRSTLPLALLLAPGCQKKEDLPCPPASSLGDDGLCYLDEAAADPGDSGATEGDSGESEGTAWQDLPEGCSPPADLPADPLVQVGSLFLQDAVFAEITDIELDLERGLAFAVGQGGLIAMDVSDPTSPSLLDFDGPRFYRLELGPEEAIYATDRDNEMAVYDGSDPDDLQRASSFFESDLSGMAAVGDRLYVVTHSGGLITYDIRDPLDPEEIDRVEGLGNPWEPKALGDRLYVADNTLGVAVIDLSDPDAPTLVGSVPAAGGAQDLAFSEDGSTLYAAVGGAGIEVFDLSDPDAPASLGLIDLHYSVISVAVDGDLLWAADQQEIVALDVSDPLAPALINAQDTEQWAMHVAAGGGRAYVADWAYLDVFEADPGVGAPDADPSSSRIYLAAEGGEVRLQVANLGGGTLDLLGASVSDERVSVQADRLAVAPGEEAEILVSYSGGEGLEASLCLATNDPDEPLQTVTLQGTTDGEGLGSEAPDFTLPGLDGQSYTLSDQRGRPVVLVYFATW